MAHSSVSVERLPVVGNPLPSIISIALVTASIGGLLAHHAHWAGIHIIAGLTGYAAMSVIIALTVGIGRGPGGFGIANQVTLLRAGLVCLAGGALLAGGPTASPGWSLAALVATALSLDAVDGLFARRLGLASRFGARFDLEVDAFLILVLALLVWQAGKVGPWVLAIGLLRYFFVLAGWLLPWLRQAAAPEPAPTGGLRAAGSDPAGLPAAAVGSLSRTCSAGLALLRLLASFGDRHHLSDTRREEPDADRGC